MNALTRNVLVLNKGWLPIGITVGSDAICKLYQGKAEVIDDNYMLHNWESWIHTWEDAVEFSKMAEEGRLIMAGNYGIVVPDVIRLTDYKGPRKRRTRPTRKAIFKRDGGICQYCGKKFSSSNLNIDHVVPKCRGGRTTWGNVVLSCFACNGKKGDKSVEEAGMRLFKQPREPHWFVTEKALQMTPPKSWEDFLGKMYWEVELDDD